VKIQEADAKSLLVAQGLPVPPWAVARTAADARIAAERFLAAGAGRVVIKAQVLVGGRGKAGGVKLAGSPAEAEEVAARILGMEIKGIPVRKVLVGPAAVIVKEFYLGAILDRASRRIVLMASAEGGVEIEEVARTTPRRSTAWRPIRSSGCWTGRRGSSPLPSASADRTCGTSSGSRVGSWPRCGPMTPTSSR
jgi:succinyl-CoA synthetase beta subunit